MSTHGCLRIRAKGERRSLLLHTYHSGYLVGKAVREAPAFSALHWFRGVFCDEEMLEHARNWDIQGLREHLGRHALYDGLGYTPTVASWIIAAEPRLYEVVTPGFYRDLADWSGADQPSQLVISEDEWRFTAEPELDIDPASFTFNPWKAMVDAVWQELHGSPPPQ